MKKYVCTVCGYIYDEAAGYPAGGIAPGTTWEAVPEGWVCPVCGAGKSEFREQAAAVNKPEPEKKETAQTAAGEAYKVPREREAIFIRRNSLVYAAGRLF